MSASRQPWSRVSRAERPTAGPSADASNQISPQEEARPPRSSATRIGAPGGRSLWRSFDDFYMTAPTGPGYDCHAVYA
jgi:hypothetical protein